MLGVFFAHNLPVAVDEAFHAVAFAQQLVPVHGVERKRIGFALNPIARAPPAQVPGVVMQRPSPDSAQLAAPFAREFFKKAAGPRPVIHVWARTYEGQLMFVARLISKAWYPGREAPEFDRVLLRGKVSAAAPRFIANAPEANIERIFESARGPHVRER